MSDDGIGGIDSKLLVEPLFALVPFILLLLGDLVDASGVHVVFLDLLNDFHVLCELHSHRLDASQKRTVDSIEDLPLTEALVVAVQNCFKRLNN